MWPILLPKYFIKAEHQLFLKLCVPKSGVLGKDEKEQFQVLQKHNVTYLKILAEVETHRRKLTELQKQYDKELSSREASLTVELLSKDEGNEEVDDILDEMLHE